MTTRNITRILVGSVTVLVVGMGSGAVVQAQSNGTPQEMLDTIRSRCSASQFALQQIEKRDAVSRINRGRAYDQMLRQVSAFNSRFAYNKISSPELIQVTGQLQDAVNAFRSHYDRYDTDITDALKVNCKEKPAEYYGVIVRAREDRNAVGEQVRRIDDLLNQYRQAVLIYKDRVE